jgi:hypothetical protein
MWAVLVGRLREAGWVRPSALRAGIGTASRRSNPSMSRPSISRRLRPCFRWCSISTVPMWPEQT